MIGNLMLFALLVVGDGADARQLFEAGSQAYEQGRFSVAIDAFEQAHKLGPRAVTAFSAAQAHRQQYFIDGDPHHLERAIELYRAYLELDPNGNRREHAGEHLATLVPILERLRREGLLTPGGAPARIARTQLIVSSRTEGALVRVDDGEAEAAPASFDVKVGRHKIEVSAPRHITQSLETMASEGMVVAQNVVLEPQPGLLGVTAPPGSRVAIDGLAIGTAPLAHAIEVRPGHHTVAVTARGRRAFVREIDVGLGQHLEVKALLESTTQRWFSIGLLSACGALLGTTAVMWGMAAERNSAASPYAARLEPGSHLAPLSTTSTAAMPVNELARYNQLTSDYNEFLRAGIITGSVALAAGTLGAVLFTFDRPDAPPTTVITPLVGPNVSGVSVSGTF